MKIFSPQMKIQNTKRKKNVKTVNSKLYCHIKDIFIVCIKISLLLTLEIMFPYQTISH